MGLISKTAQLLGFSKPNTKALTGNGGATSTFAEVFGSTSSGPAFSSFNSMRAQMLSYNDWVYAAASRVAEEAACIDFELYINNTQQKAATVGRRIGGDRKELKKYRKMTVAESYVTVKNKRVHVVRAGANALEEVDQSPLIDILDRPNKFMSGVEFFELTFLHLELTGNAFWAIIRDKKKQPVELWPLMPNYMRIVEDSTEFITGYVYTVNGEQVPFEPDDIIHHKYSNPNDLRWGMSTVMAAARTIDTDTMAADYNRKFFYNSAQPDAVLQTEKFIDDKTWLRIKDQFQDMYGGTANAHKTAILENGLEYKPMNFNQREMEFLSSRNFNRDMILAMFGVPKSVLGMDASMSRANAETAEYVFAKGTIRPKMLRLATGIQEKLAPYFDERLVVSFADPVPADKMYKLQEHKALANLVLTANEVREDMGYDPVDKGDQLYILGTMVPIGTDNTKALAPTAAKPDAKPEDEQDIHSDDNNDGGSSADSGSDNGGDGAAAGGDAGGAAEGAAKGLKRVAKGPLPIEDGCTRCNCCAGYGEHNTTGYECYRCDASGSVSEAEAKEAIPCGGREDSDELWIDDDGNYRHAEEKKKSGSTISITLSDKATADRFIEALKGLEPKKKEYKSVLAPGAYLDKRNEVADKYEPQMFKGILAHMADQEKEVLANVSKRLKALQTAKSKKVIKANLEMLFDPEASQEGWIYRLAIIFEKIIAAMGLISIEQLEEALNGEDIPPYDVTDPSVEQFYKDRIRRVSVYFDEQTQKQLAATLREGVDAGESVDELRKRVKAVYNATQSGDLMWYRAERIGRTEPIFATTWTTIDAWKKSGMVIGKRWHTAPGAVPAENNPCGFCRNMNGKIVELDSNYFDVGDSTSYEDDDGNTQTMNLTYVDTIGPPLHPNCRCTLLPVLEGESLN